MRRETRDRTIEQINSAPGNGLLLPPYSGGACGKYDVSRALAPGSAAPSVMNIKRNDGQTPMLDAA